MSVWDVWDEIDEIDEIDEMCELPYQSIKYRVLQNNRIYYS